ncbi:solute carrier family 40 member 2, chloroplastic-like isoform X2 [Triticum dicoccoides]|uniref:solute carrier family 40 member 2, chloroplastic-like isoform X2 n=1 Tax=Triticum dicoccoides TaxID=85692 RepID=UPI00188E8A2A|nr:solute carrier family 40 member 2, chloroplastic-like isoform X2 [Triticum dicoccoides]
MGMVTAAALLASSPQTPLLRGCLPGLPRLRLRPASPCVSALRSNNFVQRCYIANVEVEVSNVNKEEEAFNDHPSLPPGCSIPVVNILGDVLDSSPFPPHDSTQHHADFEELPVLSEGEQQTLAATPAHPAGLYALYVSYLFGNLVEQLWNFAWPAALAILHPSLLPVAIVGFFGKLSVFLGAPIVGKLMDHFPRIPMYTGLNAVQVATQLISAAMVIYALKNAGRTSTSALLLRPWFIVLVIAGAIERLAGLALGVSMERDWVVLLAGTNRPVALAQANAMLNRLDLLCETVGASIFGLLLTKYDIVTCLKVMLGQLINSVSCHALDSSRTPSDESICADLLDVRKIVQNGLSSIKHGWNEYKQQTVLPASVATVFLNFNIALAPGAIMTALLMHRGISPSIVGAFSGLCSVMGLVATFISSSLVKRVGILKAGAAGLIFQASLLSVALTVYWAGPISQRTPLLIFLASIALSRLGHMSYDVVGTQIIQTGVPASKANLIGGMEVSIASLAELVMLAMAIIANDVSHFGFLAILSVSSVAGAAWMFCRWLRNPTDEQRELFIFDPHFQLQAT